MEDQNGMAELDRSSWPKYEYYVLNEIKTLSKNMNQFHADFRHHMETEGKRLITLEKQVVEFKTKLAMWGSIIVALSSMISPAIQELVKSIFVR